MPTRLSSMEQILQALTDNGWAYESSIDRFNYTVVTAKGFELRGPAENKYVAMVTFTGQFHQDGTLVYSGKDPFLDFSYSYACWRTNATLGEALRKINQIHHFENGEQLVQLALAQRDEYQEKLRAAIKAFRAGTESISKELTELAASELNPEILTQMETALEEYDTQYLQEKISNYRDHLTVATELLALFGVPV